MNKAKILSILLSVLIISTVSVLPASQAVALESYGNTAPDVSSRMAISVNHFDNEEDEYTEEYLRYLEYLNNLEDSADNNWGTIPSPYHHNYTNSYVFDNSSRDLPPIYPITSDSELDSDYLFNKLTKVENQGSLDTCWAFASCATLQNYVSLWTGRKYDFSEEHMRTIMSRNLAFRNINTDTELDTDLNGIKGYYSRKSGQGAFKETAYAYLTNRNEPIIGKHDNNYSTHAKWNSIVESTDVPYTLDTDEHHWDSPFETSNSIVDVTDTILVDSSLMKSAVMALGGVHVSMIYNDNFYNTTNSAYCYDGSANSDSDTFSHSVVIVGWDDGYSASKFNSICRPNHNGAWLVRNSWGDNYGFHGYFWVSYEDLSLNSSNVGGFSVLSIKPNDSNQRMLSHDFLTIRSMQSYLYVDTDNDGICDTDMYVANVYDLTEYNTDYGTINDVMIYSEHPQVNYEIYVVPISGTSMPSISSLTSPRATGTIGFSGYQTIHLTNPYIFSTTTNKCAVIVKYFTANLNRFRVEVEGGYSHESAEMDTNESYIYDFRNNSWYDIHSESNYGRGNFCIRPILTRRTPITTAPSLLYSSGTIPHGSKISHNAYLTMNGNKLYRVSANGYILSEGKDYTFNSTTGVLNFKSSYLRQLTSSVVAVIEFTNGYVLYYDINVVKPQLNSVQIAGIQAVSKKLTAQLSFSYTSGIDTDGLTYKWQRSSNGSTWYNISGATSKTYTPPTSYRNYYIRVVVNTNNCDHIVHTEKNATTDKLVLMGDPDLNGTVNLNDVTLIQRYISNLATLNTRQFRAADVTYDGYVNSADVTKIQNYIAGNIGVLNIDTDL